MHQNAFRFFIIINKNIHSCVIQNNAILHRNRIEKLTAEAYNIDDELKPLQQKVETVISSARKQSDSTLLAFLGCWTITTVSIARLTWWEYSWDIMEPVACK